MSVIKAADLDPALDAVTPSQPAKKNVAPASSSGSFASAGLLSTLTFAWLDPLMAQGAKRQLQASDLPVLPQDDRAGTLRTRLAVLWEQELRAAGPGQPPRHAFMRAVVRFSGLANLARAPVYCVGSAARVANALLLGALIRHVQRTGADEEAEARGYALGAGMVLCTVAYTICHALYFFLAWREGLRLRVAVLGLVFDKALRLSLRGLQRVTLGGVANMATTDVEKFQMYAVHLNHLWMCPLEALVCCVLLWRELGPSCITGVVIVVALMPLQAYIARFFTRYRQLTAAAADVRVGAESQMVHGARLMKMCGWEVQFVRTIEAARAREAVHIFAANRLRACNMGVFFCAPVVVCFVSFATRVHAAGKPLTSAMVFSSLALFNIIQFAIPLVFQFAVRDLSESIVAARRIQDFLMEEEAVGKGGDRGEAAEGGFGGAAWRNFGAPRDERFGLEVVRLTCSWSQGSHGGGGEDNGIAGNNQAGGTANTAQGGDAPEGGGSSAVAVLSDVTFHVLRGELLVVVGAVGASKSSLLLALAGELPHNAALHRSLHDGGGGGGGSSGGGGGGSSSSSSSAAVRVRGAIHFAPQTPFILSGTVKDNIVLLEAAADFDAARYQAALRACALEHDLASSSMPRGDETVIGERGVNLSGGQKARVALARVCYAAREGDVVLLDDPLSAVDSKVGRHLFEHAVGGLLAGLGCTRVLVTHQVQFVAGADALLELHQGRVARFGRVRELGIAQVRAATESAAESVLAATPPWGASLAPAAPPPLHALDGGGSDGDCEEQGSGPESQRRGEGQCIPPTEAGGTAHTDRTQEQKGIRRQAGELVAEEGREEGSVTRATYAAWLRAGGGVRPWLSVCALLLAGQGASIGCGAWIWYWAALSPARQREDKI
eukprot:g7615.t1